MIYKSGIEHLTEELSKLDMLIRLQVEKFRIFHTHHMHDDFAGLYISEEEIERILRKRTEHQDESLAQTSKSNTVELLNNIKKIQEKIQRKVTESVKAGISLSLHQLSYCFHLTPFELDTILICMAPELDLKYERLYAYLQNDITKKSPSVDLILNLLCFTNEQKIKARAFLDPQAPLLKYDLVRFIDDSQQKPLLSRSLKLDDRIVNYLLGNNVLDSRLCSYVNVLHPDKNWSAVVIDNSLKEKLNQISKEHVRKNNKNRLIFFFRGPEGAGKKLVAEALCRDLNLALVIADIRQLLNNDNNLEKTTRLLFREAILKPAAIYLDHYDLLVADDPKNIRYQNIINEAIEEFSFLTFLAGEKSWNQQTRLNRNTFVQIEFPIPAYPLRKRLWEIVTDGQNPLSPEINTDALANKFRFTGGQICNAIAQARNSAKMRHGGNNGIVTLQDLYQSCRAQSNQNLSEMAQKRESNYSWSDIVLSSDKLQQLREISCYVKHRQIIYDDWGFGDKFSSGKGLNVLFSGPSGTGKTMAAEIIANELNLDLYKIDLSCVVSKYIGETEKNLSKIFNEAETCNAILFFDEADALFGKRSEVKDSHDRYANIEINYLLQKMEEHEGIVILASNFRKNIDEAFARRMHFSVEFPFPDEEYRFRIWSNIFPKDTPKDKDIDFEFLAKKFKISGGNIKNIALNSAFLAAEESKKVGMRHVIQAIKREYQKMCKLFVQSDFGKYYDLKIYRDA